MIDDSDVRKILNECDTVVDYRVIKELSYEELKSLADKVIDETDKLEELLENLKNVNAFNNKLIFEIEEMIKKISSVQKDNEEKINEEDNEIEYGE